MGRRTDLELHHPEIHFIVQTVSILFVVFTMTFMFTRWIYGKLTPSK